MDEGDTVRLVQAFVLSRITYAALYVTLSKAVQEKLNLLICKTLKQALGLPMNASTDKGNREAREKALNKTYSRIPTTAYTDATDNSGKRVMVAVVNYGREYLTSASIPRALAINTEALAIALALTETRISTIVTDSQEVCRSFTSGWVAPVMLCILQSKVPDRKVGIAENPAHFMRGNQHPSRPTKKLRNTTSSSKEHSQRHTQSSRRRWEMLLSSSLPQNQLLLVERADRAKTAHGYLK
ncbi:hypothetical protein HPB47_021796 [Ixodes persulcatus]|uniref:Uncharacterized protein n=1 Tax=Ixodes persulcatus TaxID=34615 RepID=A0AC60QBI4_IXOPE|nr:hypothetical protein HPB47_021796 [Ixodes persulcatus]